MALALLIVYCLLMFRLIQQMLKFGRGILGKYAVFMMAPVVACGAAICILLTISGGILLLLFASLLVALAGFVFEEEGEARPVRRRKERSVRLEAR